MIPREWQEADRKRSQAQVWQVSSASTGFGDQPLPWKGTEAIRNS